MRGPLNTQSLTRSALLHGFLLVTAVVVPLIPSCRPKEVPILIDFTVALPSEEAPSETPPAPVPPRPAPPTQPDLTVPDAPPPPPLPAPPKEAAVVVREKPPVKPPPKQPDPPKEKPPEKPREKQPDPPKEKPPVKPPEKTFVKGPRVNRPDTPVRPQKPQEDFTRLKPATNRPTVDRPLSREEIARALRDGARPGQHNSLPPDEASRCIALIRRALYESWEQPGAGDAGPRPALLDIRLDASGRIVSYRIRQSSGSAFFDQTVLKAVANAAPVRGLSLAFLRQYESLTIEFKLE